MPARCCSPVRRMQSVATGVRTLARHSTTMTVIWLRWLESTRTLKAAEPRGTYLHRAVARNISVLHAREHNLKT